MITSPFLVAGLGLLLLFALLVLVGRTRGQKDFRARLRVELLKKLERQPAHAGELIDELQRSGTVRVPRVYSLLERMRADGTLSSAWQHDDDARPRRVYAVAKDSQFGGGLESPAAHPANGG